MALAPTELQVGRVYHKRIEAIQESDSVTCVRLLGEGIEADDASLGIVFVWALRALIESQILPPGAIMISHEAKWLRLPPRTGLVTTEMSIEAVDPGRRRYTHVVIGYRTSDEAGMDIAFQRQGVLWPN